MSAFIRAFPFAVLLDRVLSGHSAVWLVSRVRPWPIRCRESLFPLRCDLRFLASSTRHPPLATAVLYALRTTLHAPRQRRRRRSWNHLLSEGARDHLLYRLFAVVAVTT